MGCDIHLYSERRVNGKWLVGASHAAQEDEDFDSYNYLYAGRNYDLFWVLGGIPRRPSEEFPCIAANRGLPADVSDRLQIAHESWGVDAHSAGWISLQELRQYVADHPTILDQSDFWSKGLAQLGQCEIHPDCQQLPELAEACVSSGLDDIRIVFWFDN